MKLKYGPKDLLVAAKKELKKKFGGVWLVIKKACANLVKLIKS